MAWKMIKEGNIPDYVTWTGKCSYCGAEFECFRKDLTDYHPPTQMDDAFSWENCTFCGKEDMVCMHEK